MQNFIPSPQKTNKNTWEYLKQRTILESFSKMKRIEMPQFR